MLPGVFPPIETMRLVLRCVAPQDAAATATLMTPSISRWLASWVQPFTSEVAEGRIKLVRNLADRGHSLPCAIIAKDGGSLVGWMTLTRDEDDRRRGSAAYWLGTAYQGRGFAREALSALLGAGFDRLDLDVIEAGAQVENVASIAVMLACRMKEGGIRVVHAPARGQDETCVFYERHR